jgi:hypothetical protein
VPVPCASPTRRSGAIREVQSSNVAPSEGAGSRKETDEQAVDLVGRLELHPVAGASMRW